MNQQNEAQQGQMEQQPERNAHKAFSRRKFLTQASVVSLPVLMSLKSGDAWGCVPLNCTGGEGSWSSTASAVSSVKERETGDGTISPIFDSVATIIKVVKADLGVVADGSNFLWDHVRTLRYKKTVNKKVSYPLVYKDIKSAIDLMTAEDVASWISKCQGYSNNNRLYSNSGSTLFKISGSNPLIKPMIYDGVLICADTEMSQFFSEMSSGITLLQCLSSGSEFEKYVTAAFVGSLWQKAEIWSTPYAGSVKSKHKPNCYPEISVLRQAYANVIANAPARKISDSEAAADMGRMFKAYTKL